MANRVQNEIGQLQVQSCNTGKTYCVRLLYFESQSELGLRQNFSWMQSSVALSEEKGSGTCCYCWQPNHQKLSSSPLVNQWLILPTGASLRTRKLCWTISGSVMWSSLRSHELVWCLHKIYYARFRLDISQWYCLKSPVIACGRQNDCCVKFISVQ